MLRLDLRQVANYTRKADTEDLLDRVTIYRRGMEPAALDLMEMELDRRGITLEDIAEYNRIRRETAIMLPDGTALRCNFCDRPAVIRARGWHRLLGLIPIFPRIFARCERHASKKREAKDRNQETGEPR